MRSRLAAVTQKMKTPPPKPRRLQQQLLLLQEIATKTLT